MTAIWRRRNMFRSLQKLYYVVRTDVGDDNTSWVSRTPGYKSSSSNMAMMSTCPHCSKRLQDSLLTFSTVALMVWQQTPGMESPSLPPHLVWICSNEEICYKKLYGYILRTSSYDCCINWKLEHFMHNWYLDTNQLSVGFCLLLINQFGISRIVYNTIFGWRWNRHFSIYKIVM